MGGHDILDKDEYATLKTRSPNPQSGGGYRVADEDAHLHVHGGAVHVDGRVLFLRDLCHNLNPGTIPVRFLRNG